MLLLNFPPPQPSKTPAMRWVGASIVLHILLLVCAAGMASMFARPMSARSGGVMAASIITLGSTAAGDSSVQTTDILADALPARHPASALVAAEATEKITPAEPEVKAAVPITKQKREKVPAEKPVAPQAKTRTEQKALPAGEVLRQSVGAAPVVQGSGGSSAVNGGAGEAGHVSALANGEASPHSVDWNTAGGPRFHRQGPLRYPRAAQRRNLEGKAIVEAYLDMQGHLVRARVLQADHEDFGNAALACIQASSFKPALRDGKAVPCVVRIPMLFVLKGM